MAGPDPQPEAPLTPIDPLWSALLGTPFRGPYPSFEATWERTLSVTPQLFPHPHRVSTVAPRQETPLFFPPNQASTLTPSQHTPFRPPPPISHPRYDPYFPLAETPSGHLSFHEHPQVENYQSVPMYYDPNGYNYRTGVPPQPFHLPPAGPPPVVPKDGYNQPGPPRPPGGPPHGPPPGPLGGPHISPLVHQDLQVPQWDITVIHGAHPTPTTLSNHQLPHKEMAILTQLNPTNLRE